MAFPRVPEVRFPGFPPAATSKKRGNYCGFLQLFGKFGKFLEFSWEIPGFSGAEMDNPIGRFDYSRGRSRGFVQSSDRPTGLSDGADVPPHDLVEVPAALLNFP